MDTTRLLDYEGITSIIPLKVPTLRKMVSQRRIPFVKLGSRVFFDVAEIEKWLESQHVPTGRNT